MKTTRLQKNILKTFEIYVMILRGFANETWQLIQVMWNNHIKQQEMPFSFTFSDNIIFLFSGMNFYDFFVFIVRFALANIIELYHRQQPEVATFLGESAHHFVYNLKSIRNVASTMTTTEAFTTENIGSISEDNCSAFSNVKRILEEENFRRLLMTLSKSYEHIHRRQINCLKSCTSYLKGCLSVICLKSDCNIVDHIISLIYEVCVPADLVILIDSALADASF